LEEEPLVSFGIVPVWAGVGMAWLAERQPMRDHPYARPIARAIRRAWREWSPAYRYIEALVRHDRSDSQRLAWWLGLRPVHTKPGYGPAGETLMVYEWRGASL
jgi:hypothetical protein